MKFSPSNLQFYPDDIGYEIADVPGDVVDSTPEDFAAAMDRAPGESLNFESGRVVIVPAPEIDTVERLGALERYWRSQQLAQTDAVVTRHRDELEDGSETTLTPAQYSELQAYRRGLRDWPENGEFPLAEHRPMAPPWLAGQLQ
ncbi:phage tail assembly chaperone [Pseudomonas chlororaphis]